MEKFGNDKNDFLQTQRIRQLDKYCRFFQNQIPGKLPILRKVDAAHIALYYNNTINNTRCTKKSRKIQMDYKVSKCGRIFIMLEPQSEKLWHENYNLRPQNYKLRVQNLHV